MLSIVVALQCLSLCHLNRAFSCHLNRAISCHLNRAISCQVNRAITRVVNRAFTRQVNRATKLLIKLYNNCVKNVYLSAERVKHCE